MFRSKVTNFNVFVSFRGIDTRRTFVSHLLLSLMKEKFRTFKSEEEIPQDQPATSEVLQAIEESKIAIVVISKNYTASISCLDELAMIIECNEEQSLVVVPVLYEVDRSDVLRQAYDFGDSSGDGDNNNLEKVNRWRDALRKAIQIYHLDCSYWNDEEDSYIIDRVMTCVSNCWRLSGPFPLREPPRSSFEEAFEISADVQCVAAESTAGRMMGQTARPAGSFVDVQKDKHVIGTDLSPFVLSDYFNSFVGMDRRTRAVKALLQLQLSDTVGGIGICGVQGVGKTTLARCVYEHISPQFQDHYYFIVDTKSYSTCLLEEITRDLLSTTSDSESESLVEVVKAKLGHRKVLLIVDELHYNSQLKNIWKFCGWFGPGSRLILITENKDLLVQCRVRHIYEVDSMRYDEALQLFSQFAFKQEQVPRCFYRLSVRAVLVTCRIPLALKLFGSFLRGKCINDWEFELSRLEASQDNCVARVSSYIGDAFS